MRETTLSATIVADMLQYLERHGVPAADALRQTGLQLALPPHPDQRVAGGDVERLWEFAVSALRDPCAGLHMAESYSPGTLDILGYVLLSCSTIGELFDRLTRYVRVLNDGLRAELLLDAREAHMRCTFVEGVDNYLHRRPREAMDSLWGGMARELGRMTASPLRATEVWFAHASPPSAQLSEYTRVLGCPVYFGKPENRFTVPRAALDTPLLSANPALLQLFSHHADEVIAKIDAHRGSSRKVMSIVAARMNGRVPTLREVARELAMSDRNLQRTLQADGTSYQKLVDDLRREMAISHLRTPGTSAGQVGFLLGFSEPSAFHRAFRRWTGQAPSAFRREVAPLRT